MVNKLKFYGFLIYKMFFIGIVIVLFFSSSNVYANMLSKKKADWAFSSGEKINNLEVASNGTVYIFSETELNVYDRYGTMIWRFTASNNDIEKYEINNDIVYISTSKNLFSLNPDGSERWCFNSVNDEIIKSFELGIEGDAYVQTTSEFYSLDPVDGQENWHFSNGEEINSYKLLESEGLVYIVTSNSVYALDVFSNT